MKKFFRSTLSWFRSADAPASVEISVVPPSAESALETSVELPAVQNVIAIDSLKGEEIIKSVAEVTEALAPFTPKASEAEIVASEFQSVLVQTEVIEPVEAATPAPAAIVNEPGLPMTVFIRGARHYGTCPHCESAWSLRERLFDPRAGRALDVNGLACPNCKKSVALPADLNLKTIR